MEIKILGGGCAKCEKLEKNAVEAVKSLGLEATVTKVKEMDKIVGYGVMSTPALVVDEKVIVSGKVPNAKAIAKMLG